MVWTNALLLLLSSVSLSWSHCYQETFSQCDECSSFVLNCEGNSVGDYTGFNDLQSYGYENPKLKSVIFHGHKMELLDKNVLGNVSHDMLSLLNLTNNQIKRIDPGAFHHMKNLKTLILDDNEWNFNESVIHPRVFNHSNLLTFSLNNAFATLPRESRYTREVVAMLKDIFVNSSMVSLTNLSMSHNALYGLPDDFFDGMPNLEVLDLSNNRFYGLAFRLQKLTKLRALHLHGNYMITMDNHLLEDISTLYDGGAGVLQNVTLSGNPIKCDCTAKDFWRWLQTGNKSVVIDINNIYCEAATTDDMVGKPLTSLKLSQLECKVGKKGQSFVVLGVVMGLVAAVALVILILNRSIFINRYLACKETVGSKHEHSVYSPKYSSVH